MLPWRAALSCFPRFVTATVVLMSIQTAEAVGLFIPCMADGCGYTFCERCEYHCGNPRRNWYQRSGGSWRTPVFGIPFAIGAQWVLANRVLVFCVLSHVRYLRHYCLWVRENGGTRSRIQNPRGQSMNPFFFSYHACS